ncbi:MAG: protein kinase [Myxococcales bacterium]|nr:protein kinase [Myxococcales bacterium]
MATVHVGRLMGPVGFARTVAIKRLHSHFANDPEFVAMFMDEAHLAARIRHPNVVSISDVVAEKGELLLVMDYVAGESLSKLVRANRRLGQTIDPRIVVKVLTDALAGLHAAHEVRDDDGQPLGVVHRDVSPQNILVGVDGVTQLIDFGVAKAAGRIQTTREGQLKGKLGYMPPEQIQHGVVDRRTDIYSAAVVLWEALTGERLFKGEDANLMYEVLHAPVEPPSHIRKDLPPELDAVVMRGLARDPNQRFASALDFADALEDALAPASAREVARWVQATGAEALKSRSEIVADMESDSSLYADLSQHADLPRSSAAPRVAPIELAQVHPGGHDEPRTLLYSRPEGEGGLAALEPTPAPPEVVVQYSELAEQGLGVRRSFKPLHLALALAGVVVGGAVLALGLHLTRSEEADATPAATQAPIKIPEETPAAAATRDPGAEAGAASALPAGAGSARPLGDDEPPEATAPPSSPSDTGATREATDKGDSAPKPAARPRPLPAHRPAGLSDAERKAKYGF